VVPGFVRRTAPTGNEADVRQAAPSFREVFDKHARYVWRSLLGLGVHERDVADASQHVFLVVHDRLASDQVSAGALRTFVYGVCLRVASDFRRRAHRRHERLFADPPEPTQPPEQEQAAWHRQALAQLDAVLAGLPVPQREAFVLYEIEELTMTEVARALGCPLQTAYSRLHAARRAVTSALGEPTDAGEPGHHGGGQK
jgi:RNA polymerase sigma-70 factor (ECF subfamily)